MSDVTEFKLDEALAAQKALRDSLAMPEELFPVEDFVRMISDEIVASREAGRDDQTIVDLVKQVTGKTITVDEIEQHLSE